MPFKGFSQICELDSTFKHKRIDPYVLGYCIAMDKKAGIQEVLAAYNQNKFETLENNIMPSKWIRNDMIFGFGLY